MEQLKEILFRSASDKLKTLLIIRNNRNQYSEIRHQKALSDFGGVYGVIVSAGLGDEFAQWREKNVKR